MSVLKRGSRWVAKFQRNGRQHWVSGGPWPTKSAAREAERRYPGLPNVRWHDLRHFCATQLLELGLDHFAVSVQLGHEDGGALVMARYGHPSKDAARGRLLRAFELTAAGVVPTRDVAEARGA